MRGFEVDELIFHNLGPLSFRIAPQECVCLAGASGVGKTLLLRALADIDTHTGQLILNGKEHQEYSAPQWRKNVMMLPANIKWWHDTVEEHFKLNDSRLMTDLGLNVHMLSSPVQNLSAGESQRLGILRMLSCEPDVLLLDEPTANLDQKNTLRVEHVLLDFLRTKKACILWVTHDLAQIERIANRQLLLKDGTLQIK